MTAEERIAELEEQLKQALGQVQRLQEELAAAQQRIEALENQKTPPVLVKANVKKLLAGEKKPRKKRDAKHNHARRRETPTCMIEYAIKHCPVCASALGGISVVRRRQVIELPVPAPVKVSEHVIFMGGAASANGGAKHRWTSVPRC